MKPLCLNCEAPLAGDARFCAQCGQKAATRRLTLRDIAHEIWHAITHTDHSVLGLIKALLRRPGLVAADFVDGHRKRYFNPFTFLVVAVGLTAVVMASTGIGGFSGGMHRGPVGQKLQANLNLVILAQVPLLALWGRWLWWRGSRNLAEHLVLAAYSSGLRSLFFLFGVIPIVMLLRELGVGLHYGYQIAAYLLVWVVYFGWASAQFHRGDSWRWTDWLRGSAVALFAQLTGTGLISLAFWLNWQLR